MGGVVAPLDGISFFLDINLNQHPLAKEQRSFPLEKDALVRQRELDRIVPNSDGLTRTTPTLDATGLIHRQADGCLSCRQARQTTIGAATNQQRAANNTVCVTMD